MGVLCLYLSRAVTADKAVRWSRACPAELREATTPNCGFCVYKGIGTDRQDFGGENPCPPF